MSKSYTNIALKDNCVSQEKLNYSFHFLTHKSTSTEPPRARAATNLAPNIVSQKNQPKNGKIIGV